MTTFRFSFSDEVISTLDQFAKLHRHDERKAFKAAWQKMVTENEVVKIQFSTEVEKQKQDGHNGDIMDKMFKSTRYYHRKKNPNQDDDDNINKKPERKQHFRFSSEMLKNMDAHIKLQNDDDISPSKKYEDYCIKNRDMIMKEIIRIKEELGKDLLDKNEVSMKFKKTYKNRIYSKGT